MGLRALLFDLDGTLVDTNEVHVDAWLEVLARRGHHPRRERVAREIGKGGRFLVEAVLGPSASRVDLEDLPEAESARFRELVAARHVAAVPAATRLLAAARERGLATAIATSSQVDQLDGVMQSLGLDLRERVDATITADDVRRAKPYPDPVRAAAAALGVEPARCALVGDTAHDVDAAALAGAASVGVATFVWTREELVERGASSAWADPADLEKHLDRALELAARR